MSIVASLEAVALVAVVYLMLRHQSRQTAASERLVQSMADRIQHPERVQVQTQPWVWPEDSELDEVDMVGTIAEPKGDE